MNEKALDIRIEEIKSRLIGFDALKYYKQNWQIDTHFSNAIEGNTIPYGDTMAILAGKQPTKGTLYEINEILGYARASKIVVNIIEQNKKLGIDLIQELHRALIKDSQPMIAGNLRERGDEVYASGSKVIYTEGKNVGNELQMLLKQEQNSLTDILKFKCDFEKIHPFIDGNGRVGRLLMHIMLIRMGYPILIIRTDEAEEYKKSLETAQVTGDYTTWLMYAKARMLQAFTLIECKLDFAEEL